MAPDPDTMAGELQSHHFRIAALEAELAEIKVRVISEAAPASEFSAQGLKLADVLAVTKEMFSSEPITEIVDDPENFGVRFILLTVRAQGDVDQLIQKQLDWHDRVASISPNSSGMLRLSIIPEE